MSLATVVMVVVQGASVFAFNWNQHANINQHNTAWVKNFADYIMLTSVAMVQVRTGFGLNQTIFLTRPDQTNINQSKKSQSVYASVINGYEQFELQLISILG